MGNINLNLKTIFKFFNLTIILFIFASCLPTPQDTDCGSNEEFDPTKRKCIPALGSNTGGTIFISSRSPENSYTMKISDPSVTHSVAVNDSLDLKFSSKWVLHYTGDSGVTNDMNLLKNSLTFEFDPSSLLGVGNYILEVIILDVDEKVLLDTVEWNIVVTDKEAPSFKNPDPRTSTVSFPSDQGALDFSLNIENNDSQSGIFNCYVNGDLNLGTTGNFDSLTDSISTSIDTTNLGVGVHSVECELTDSLGEFFNSHLWTILITEPNHPKITDVTSLDTSESIFEMVAVNEITMENNGYLDSNKQTITGFCITVDDADLNDDGISDVDYSIIVNGVSISNGTFAGADLTNNKICINDLSAQELINPDIGQNKTLTVKLFKKDTAEVVDLHEVSLVIRPKNITPTISIDSSQSSIVCSNTSNNLSFKDCSMNQSLDHDSNGSYADGNDFDGSEFFAISINDDDLSDAIDDDQEYEVFFKLKRDGDFEDLDTANAFSSSNCIKNIDDDENDPNQRRKCQLHVEAFKDQGPIPAGNYTLEAFVRDNGSNFEVSNKESNHVTWEITVSEHQTASISIKDQDVNEDANHGEGNTLSWIEKANSCDPLDGQNEILDGTPSEVLEGEFIIVHTAVEDFDRDNLNLKISIFDEISNDFILMSDDPIVVTRTDGNLIHTTSHCFQIQETVIDGTNNVDISKDVQIKVEVSDSPDEENAVSSEATFSINVKNVNPPPTIDDTVGGDQNKTILAGYPLTLTIENNKISDASTANGENITWKWQVKVDAIGFNDIPNANSNSMESPSLNWTPSLTDLGEVTLRLCVGDDGGNSFEACSTFKDFTLINVVPSLNELSTNENPNNLSTWFDPEKKILYSAFDFKDAGNTKIKIKKMKVDPTDQNHFETDEIEFDALEGSTNDEISNLTLSGFSDVDNQFLYLSYTINDASNESRYQIREIYIQNEKLSFDYTPLFNDSDEDNDLITISNNLTTIDDGSRGVTIDFTNFAAGDSVTIGTETFSFDNVCTGNDCTTAENKANSFKFTIESSSLNKRIHLVPTNALITISGFPLGASYSEDTKITSKIGNILVKEDKVILPYIDSSNDQLGIAVMNINSEISPVNNNITGILDISEVKAAFNSTKDRIYYITKNNFANASIHRSSQNNFDNISEFNENVFDLTNSQVTELSISVSLDSNNSNIIWFSSIILDTDSNKKLGVGVINENLSDVLTSNDLATTLNIAELQDVSKAKIVSRNNTDESVIAFTTSLSESYIAKIEVSASNNITNASLQQASNISQNLDTQIVDNTDIAITPILNFSVDGTAKNIFFYSWFADASKLNFSILNIQNEELTSSESIEGSGPAILAPLP